MQADGAENTSSSARQIRILLLSYYFPPERTPGAFRSEALLKALLNARPPDADHPVYVDVLAAQPSRYLSSTEPGSDEETGPLHCIRRLSVPYQAVSYLAEAANFATFAARTRKTIKNQRYDLVFSTTSRQMTGLLGALLATSRGACFYLDIRDLFAENLKDMLPWPLRPLAWITRWAERWSLGRADRISITSEGFLPYLQNEGYAAKVKYFPNGADEIFFPPLETRAAPPRGAPIEIVYAGNIGAGQELCYIVPELAARLGKRVWFRIIGDGHQLSLLRAAIEKRALDNVALEPPVDRAELPSLYARSDILFLHLGRAASLKGVLPSKVFEYAASGRPILAGVSGHPARFIKSEIDNAEVFTPGDADAALEGIIRLKLSHTDRSAFIRRFSRKEIVRQMAEDILGVVMARLYP